MGEKHLWWQYGIVYQIYPRSFLDSSGDGIGDLEGIVRKLDYVQDLGVNAIWISPIYPSPMKDFGYDVSDYTGIHPMFGTMDDFDRLLEEVHRRGMKLILDFVPNHTSDQHPWFIESRSSRDSPKRDWYLWLDPDQEGGPPNNWLSAFGGKAWEYDQKTEQYYYHAFLKEQPDLNWRNREVRDAMYDVMRFWLDKGVDGFRVDVMWHLIKDAQFRDNPPNPDYNPQTDPPYHEVIPAFSTDQQEVHDVVSEMRSLLDEYDQRVMIAEIYLPIGQLVEYYGLHGSGAHLPFNFELIVLPWNARKIAAAIDKYEGSLPPWGWPNWVLGNHDKPRVLSRVGKEQAPVAATLLLTLRGTPTMYYGDEIGMHDVAIPHELVHDPQEKLTPGLGLGRDPQRTPMQWTSGGNAGFSTGDPWLPVPEDHVSVNVEDESADPGSLLTFYRRLIRLRQSEPALNVGAFIPINTDGDLLAYIRRDGERSFLVALNLGHRPGIVEFEHREVRGEVVLATDRSLEGTRIEKRLELQGDSALIILLDPNG
ncbi:MAG: alpha-amylase family glycosyl hydrolase [Thermoanaerobaculia bacterium]